MKHIAVFCLFLLVLPYPALAAGHTYYVARTGRNTNSGTMAAPWQSIQYAVKQLAPGDLLYIRGGTYLEQIRVSNSGTAAAPIRISAYPGEKVIIDGQYRVLSNYWDPLLKVGGSYVWVSRLEIKNSYGMGLSLLGTHDRASFIHSHHNMESGIAAKGDYDIVEDSIVNDNCQSNANGVETRSSWSAGLTASRHPSHAVLRRNRVFNNWGEGLSTFESTYTTIAKNVVYNNYSTNIYVSDAAYTMVRGNIVYESTDAVVNIGTRTGIMMGDETKQPPSSNNTIINNLVYGANHNFFWWKSHSFAVDGMVNDLVANNTFVNSIGNAGVEISASPDHQNTRFINNIIVQNGTSTSGMIASNITTGHNLWSKAPYSGRGPGDIIAGPLLARSYPVVAGGLKADWFRIKAGSPAINRALVLAPVSQDFYGRSRGLLPDMGAIEYMATSGAIQDVNGDGVVDITDIAMLLENPAN